MVLCLYIINKARPWDFVFGKIVDMVGVVFKDPYKIPK